MPSPPSIRPPATIRPAPPTPLPASPLRHQPYHAWHCAPRPLPPKPRPARIYCWSDSIGQSPGRLGFEDFCSILGLPASDKYSGSVERVIRAINTHCCGENRLESLRQFYAQYVLVNALRNTDAHLKNSGLIYAGANTVRLAPVYDMLRMGAYSPATPKGDCQDQPALTFRSSRRWLTVSDFAELARRCEVGPHDQARVVKRLTDALELVGQEVLQGARDDSAFRSMGQQVLELWSQAPQ